ncbi:long-chain-fatty-acid--CoA ligase 1 isoform a [Pimephales promelas]|nr:long-chain-fatty-acid--CoA ligase 1 isoform a [Pimephales promelas]
MSLSSFQVLCNLGEGQYSHTQLVLLKSDPSCKFALKSIRKQAIQRPGQRERMLSEKHILMDLQSPFIVRLYCTFKDPRFLYMLMEACEGGDLWILLRDRGSLEEDAVRFYAACVLEALSVLHGKGIVHRDLKPENVLLDQRGYAKLTGFGCAKKLASLHRAWSFCGSVGYQPPEVILHQGHGLSADLWALGMLLYELLSSRPLFSGSEPLKVYTAALKGTDELEFPKTISRTAAHLIKSLCRLNPLERLGQRNGVKDICKHMWFEGFDWEGLRKGTLTPPVIPNVRSVSDHGGPALLDETHIEEASLEDSSEGNRETFGGRATQIPHTAMQFQEWLRSLRFSGGDGKSEMDNLKTLLPSLPPSFSLSSLSLSPSSIIGLGALASLTTYWLVTRPRAIQPPCDLQAQSIPVQGDQSCRRSALLKDDNLLEFYYEDTKTAYDMFQRGLRIAGDGPCLGFRKPREPYQWISYTEVAERAQVLGSGLLAKGCKPNPQQFVGIYAQNRPEWVITELACYTFSMALVPLYDTLGLEAMVHILNLAEISMVICDKEDKAESLLKNKENSVTPTLSCLVLFNPFSAALLERGRKCGVEIVQLSQIMDLGRENLRSPVPPKPEDLAVVCFTSGTTGKPKGAMITHGNIASNTSSVIKILEGFFVIRQEDVSISYLPLAHMFERMIQVSMFCHGARVGFYQGDISLLMDDIKTLKPTFFPVVPRLLNRIYDKILGSVTSPLRRVILHYAVRRKQAELSSGVVRNNSLWDRLIFNKIQASLGGNLRFILTASAPISPTVLSFLRATLGCLIFEGYGQTECTAGCTFSMPGDWSAGHVGAPLPCAMVKLTDIPDMNYYAKNGEGEICIRGPSVFRGYLKDEERTGETLDADGWLHTGDVGQWLPNGTLRIVDRKKNIFKLSQGEYIAPEKIENVYTRCVPVLQVFVHGDSLQSYLVGVVVPDPEVFVDWAKERGIVGSYEELCQNPDVKKAVLEDMAAVGKEAGLKSFEQSLGCLRSKC